MLTIEKIRKGIRLCREQGLSALVKAILGRQTGEIQTGSVKESWTGYMDWLTYANAGMLNRGNAYCIDYAIQNIQSKSPIVEIGSFCGLSTNMITYFKEKYNVKTPLVTCDRWIFEGSEHGGMLSDSKSVSHAEYRDFVKETYMRNVKMFSRYDLPFTMEMFSDEFFSAWNESQKHKDVFGREFSLGGRISFCYIDGNHSYEFAKRDFANCDKYLDRGGFVLFDDSADGSRWEGVCRVVKEVSDNGRYELVAKNPNYFFRKK
jgi:hypothetical protein